MTVELADYLLGGFFMLLVALIAIMVLLNLRHKNNLIAGALEKGIDAVKVKQAFKETTVLEDFFVWQIELKNTKPTKREATK